MNTKFQNVFTFEDSLVWLLPAGEPGDTQENTEVRELMKEFGLHSPLGPDGFSPSVFVECAKTLDKPLLMEFKISLTESKILAKCKKTNIVSLFKEGDWEVGLNY